MKRRVALPVIVAVLWCTQLAPAAAHPFGPPPTARVTAADRTVSIAWSATPDDTVAIGELLGVMPKGSVAAYRQEAAAQVAPSSRDEAALSASPLLAEYLTSHIVVEQNGQRCDATVTPPPDFVHQGATVQATCPAPVEQVTLRITMLQDINKAYRTVAVGEGTDPGQAVFTVEAPAFDFRFGASASTSPFVMVPPVVLGAAVAAIVVVITIAMLVLRRRRASGG